ncbi:biotin/lipoyl-binding protein [Achromobacter xylosoxidans]
MAPLVVAPRSQAILADLPGRISPVRVAEVRARVAGIVQKRHFEEGATVKEGDLLFTIEPAPFEAALARAQGALARAQAQVRQAQALADRYQPLVKIAVASAARNTTTPSPPCRPPRPTRCRRRPTSRPPSSTWAMPACARRSRAASAGAW